MDHPFGHTVGALFVEAPGVERLKRVLASRDLKSTAK